MNSIALVGRLTRNPELDATRTGTPVCRMRLAVPRRRKEGKDQGAVFVTVLAFGGQATTCAGYLTTGRQVAVSGRLEHREWSDTDGASHALHEVVADHVEFLAHANGNGAEPNGASPGPEPAAAGDVR